MKKFQRSMLSLALTAAVASTGVEASTVRWYGANDVPNPRVVANILGAKELSGKNGMRSRGIETASDTGKNVSEEQLVAAADAAVQAWDRRFNNQPAALPASASSNVMLAPVKAAVHVSSVSAAAKPTALAIAVNFALDSAALTSQSTRALDAVAEGIKLAGFARPIVIEGHADASGEAAHNLALSRQRAESAKRYLTQIHGIPARALITVGYGSGSPLDATNPYASQNRRVQFRAADA